MPAARHISRLTGVSAGDLRTHCDMIRMLGGQGRSVNVGSAVLVVVLIVVIVGGFLGWHANRLFASNSDIKINRNRISGYRKTRWRSGLISGLLLIAAIALISTIVHH
jgi:hypothetical protein